MTDYQFNPNVEQWKAIPDFPGYEISDQGSVRSYWRRARVPNKRGTIRVICALPGKILRQFYDRKYGKIGLYKNGERTRFFTHRLVLETFIGPCPPGMEACHADGNPQNSFFINLRWDTPKNNCMDRTQHGRHPVGEKSCKAKLKTNQVIKIRIMAKQGYSQRHLAKLFAVSFTAIRYIVIRRTWKYIP